MAFCSNCGNQISEGANFCPKCGVVQEGAVKKDGVSQLSVGKPLSIVIGSFIISIIIALCLGSLAEKGESISDNETSSVANNVEYFAGKYELEGGIKLVVNKDETVRLTTSDGTVYPGSIECHKWNDYASFEFSLSNSPKIKGLDYFVPVMGKKKDYLYKTVSAFKSKDESSRVKIVKK